MAGLFKRILRSAPMVRLAAYLIAFYVRFVHATSRWEARGIENPQAFWRDGKPFITAFWHGRLLMMPLAWATKLPMHVLISQHRDGELIARAINPFSIGTVRGSTAKQGKADKGGTVALRGLLQLLKRGEYISITPDGPRGPRMRASTGIVAAARLARVPILPLTYGVARRRIAGSWDRFVIPWPFNCGIYIWGEPIDVHSDPNESLEQAALRVEAALNAMCEVADRHYGLPPIAPAESIPAQDRRDA